MACRAQHQQRDWTTPRMCKNHQESSLGSSLRLFLHLLNFLYSECIRGKIPAEKTLPPPHGKKKQATHLLRLFLSLATHNHRGKKQQLPLPSYNSSHWAGFSFWKPLFSSALLVRLLSTELGHLGACWLVCCSLDWGGGKKKHPRAESSRMPTDVVVSVACALSIGTKAANELSSHILALPLKETLPQLRHQLKPKRWRKRSTGS